MLSLRNVILSLFVVLAFATKFPLRAEATAHAAEIDARTIVIDQDIIEDTLFEQPYRYVLVGEIHVREGVTLTLADGVTILLRNGKFPGVSLNKSALLFDPGSRLEADTFSIKAGDARNRIERRADNGGVWFLGTYKDAAKDGITVAASPGTERSRFRANLLVASYLGVSDPLHAAEGKDDDHDLGDDRDGVSVMGLDRVEWKIQAVHSEFSGDDGFDVTNSRLRLARLSVRTPMEDGLNISSSRLEISGELSIAMTQSKAPDRELFDLEVDDGPSFVVMERACHLKLNGYFGDEVRLKSLEMPQPDPKHKQRYELETVLKQSASSVFSIDQD